MKNFKFLHSQKFKALNQVIVLKKIHCKNPETTENDEGIEYQFDKIEDLN